MTWREPGGWVVTRQGETGREVLYCPAAPGFEAHWREWWTDHDGCPPEACRGRSRKEADRWATAFSFQTRIEYVKPDFRGGA